MSTERRSDLRRERVRRGYVGRLVAVVGGLAVAAAVLTGVGVTQGPRVTGVEFDAEAAVDSNGSRLIVTTNQTLEEVTSEQVTVTPAVDFTVDTSGRAVGVRFPLPLYDDTTYTVRIEGMRSAGGGPDLDVEEELTTPALEPLVLQRSEGEDEIVRTAVDGSARSVVFAAEMIEDFRETASHLVASTWDEQTQSALVVTDLEGGNPRSLSLPGSGTVTALQSADRGNLVGYVYTDADVGTTGAIENALYTVPLSRPDAEPTLIERPGGESRVVDWRFVPGTDSILMLTFDGALTLVNSDGTEVALGNAQTIAGIAPGSTTAYVERTDGFVAIDLTTAQEVPLDQPADLADLQRVSVTPLPTGGHVEVRSLVEDFTVFSTDAYLVDGDDVRSVFAVDPGDALLHTCVSPSARYAAFLVAPDLVDNPYDAYRLPLPTTLTTRIVELDTGDLVGDLPGFDISWCQQGPPL